MFGHSRGKIKPWVPSRNLLRRLKCSHIIVNSENQGKHTCNLFFSLISWGFSTSKSLSQVLVHYITAGFAQRCTKRLSKIKLCQQVWFGENNFPRGYSVNGFLFLWLEIFSINQKSLVNQTANSQIFYSKMEENTSMPNVWWF